MAVTEFAHVEHSCSPVSGSDQAELVINPVTMMSEDCLPCFDPMLHVDSHKKTSKTVRFSNIIQIEETEHIKDMSKEERALRWFTREDYWMIKMDVLDHIRVGKHFGWQSSTHAERNFVNANGDVAIISMRGIRSEEQSIQRRRDQQLTTSSVLNEQMLQRSEGGTIIPEIIAMLYNLMSFASQQRALEIGMRDAVCVYGTNENYRRTEYTTNVLTEPLTMDVETLCVEESVVQYLQQQTDPSLAESIEDWLFERYQRGQILSQAGVHSNRIKLDVDTSNPLLRGTQTSGRDFHMLDSREETVMLAKA